MTTDNKKVIALQRDATCTTCGASLKAGEQARYYGAGKIYCLGEHKNAKPGDAPAPAPAQAIPANDKAEMLRALNTMSAVVNLAWEAFYKRYGNDEAHK